MNLGDKLWYHDATKYVPRDKQDPMARWEQLQIIGQTRISWFIGPIGSTDLEGYGVHKVKKVDLIADLTKHRFSSWAADEDAIRRRIWMNTVGGYQMGERARRVDDYDTLVKLDELLKAVGL